MSIIVVPMYGMCSNTVEAVGETIATATKSFIQ